MFSIELEPSLHAKCLHVEINFNAVGADKVFIGDDDFKLITRDKGDGALRYSDEGRYNRFELGFCSWYECDSREYMTPVSC